MQENEKLVEAGKKYIMNTYSRLPLAVVKGEGSYLWDADGKQYLDFVGGLAVTALGHCHPGITEAISKQSQTLIHCSNLYWIEPQVQLAEMLVKNSSFDKVFFANSGAEANEGAIKLARKYASTKMVDKDKNGENGDASAPYEIITMTNSFHGRTLATLTATGQEKFHRDFNPLPIGFKYSPLNDLQALKQNITEKTCAIMLEPIQGEGGVNVVDQKFLQGVKAICQEEGLLLIFDEVQVGVGRTGTLFAYENFGVTPDIITLAKGLGGGVPIGALLATDKVAAAFVPGDHASTFGGNPLVCSVGVAVLNTIKKENVLNNVVEMNKLALERVYQLKKSCPIIKEVRGKGLIIGIEVTDFGPQIVSKCQERGLLVNCAAGKVVRLLPALNISKEEMEEGLKILLEVLTELAHG